MKAYAGMVCMLASAAADAGALPGGAAGPFLFRPAITLSFSLTPRLSLDFGAGYERSLPDLEPPEPDAPDCAVIDGCTTPAGVAGRSHWGVEDYLRRDVQESTSVSLSLSYQP